jgi:large subunit ribosomal protein L35
MTNNFGNDKRKYGVLKMRKTKKAVARRFRVNKSGRVKFKHPGSGHLMTGKSRSRKRRLRKSGTLTAADESRIRRLLPHG